MKRCLLAIVTLALPLSAQSLPDVFGRIDKAGQSFKGLSATIKRDLHTAVINDDTIQDGTIKLKHSKHETKMLIDLTGVDAETVSLDGTNVSIFYPRIKEIQVYDVGKNRSLIDQFLLLGFGATSAELKSAYTISYAGQEEISGQKTDHIELVPKSPEVLQKLKKAELWISQASGLPLQQKFVTSAGGDFTMVTYSRVQVNPSLSDKDLKLKTPQGVKTVYPQK